jgi:uncharacterized protein (DUF2147 family)
MLKACCVTAAALGLSLASVQASHASAADITGVWLAQSRGAHVQISRCGESYCGKIISADAPKSNPHMLDVHNKDPALRDRSMIGTVFMEGFDGGPVKWTGGKLYNPGDGNFYKGVITLVDQDHLQLKGCAFWFLCKSQTWTRIRS